MIPPLHCIATVGKNFGIGDSNSPTSIPWNIPDVTTHFKQHTYGHVVIMGSSTFLSVLERRPLPGRLNIVVTNSPHDDKFAPYFENKNTLFLDFPTCLKFIEAPPPRLEFFDVDDTKEMFHPDCEMVKYYVIGGQSVFNLFKPYINYIHLTHIQHPDHDYSFDRFFFHIPNQFSISNYSKQFRHLGHTYRFIDYLRIPTTKLSTDHIYLNLCYLVITHGEWRKDRTGTGTMALFGQQMKFDIRHTIPILTTKRVPWKSCIEELLWFLKGRTDAKYLDRKGVKIWNGNSSREFLDNHGLNHLEEGDCGANYSFQWRHHGASYIDCRSDYQGQGVDQIAYIEHLLRHEPTSRRIFLSAWNPSDLYNTVLPPCHVSCQFYVDNNQGLSCHLYQRSCDMFLGVPWNILSYSVLTYLLAYRHDLTPKELIISTGDTHVYINHLNQMHTQRKRDPLAYPILTLHPDIKTKTIDELSIDDFDLIGYFPHASIKGTMSV